MAEESVNENLTAKVSYRKLGAVVPENTLDYQKLATWWKKYERRNSEPD